ncbi:MAG: sulfite exporter TauE/SafE family protein [Pseudomonadales bacterium]|nr:sulfite exporter TauE/SafE family protein [Gammaproteobacteria bacterium]NNL56570.1 sulfite exporter TauE/SafE family protein [Pseudomonadales bacterium]
MLFLVGIIIGCVLGLTGSGGSVFAVPLLLALAGLDAAQAVGLSLAAVAATACVGVIIQLRQGTIQWLPALVFAAIGSLLAPLGNWLGQRVAEHILLAGFAVLLVVIADRMWQQATRKPERARIVRGAPASPVALHEPVCRGNDYGPFKPGWRCAATLSGSAAATGLLAGLFGVGGGFLVVPALRSITAITMQQAVATSLAVIALIGLSGFTGFMLSGHAVSWSTLGIVASGGAVGMLASSVLGQRISGPALQKTLAAFMLLTSAYMLFRAVASI